LERISGDGCQGEKQVIIIGGKNMKPNGSILRGIQFLVCLFILLLCFSGYGAEVVKLTPGTQLPQSIVGVPDSAKVQQYLGLKNNKPFKLENISGKMVIMWFVSVF
jgi:hypothetical protein